MNIIPAVTGIDGTSSFNETVCPGFTLCFDVFCSDANPDQSVQMSWDEGISGASFIVSPDKYPTGHFCWTPENKDARTTPHEFSITVRDNAEPVPGIQVYHFSILVPKLQAKISSADVTCFGNADGHASVYVTGGSGNYSYLWSHDGESGETVTGLPAGNYSVNVMDDYGCELNAWTTISEASPLSLSLASVAASEESGSAAVSVSGGTMPYRYAWFPSGGHNAEAHNLDPGIYTAVINDANGCSTYGRINVDGSNGLVISPTAAPFENTGSQNNSDGMRELNAGGMIDAYPNPFNERLFIRNQSPEMVTISVINSIGGNLYEQIRVSPRMEVAIPTEELASGIYLIKVIQQNEVRTLTVVRQ